MALRFGRFVLDEACRELRLDGEPWPLQPLVYGVLCYLIRHRDRAVGKDELFENLWPDTFVTESSLQKAVSLVRSALREGDADDAIRTLPRQGYRFVAEVKEVPDAIRPDSIPAGDDGLARSIPDLLSEGDVSGAVAVAIQLARGALARLELASARGWTLRAERMLGAEERNRDWGLVHSMHARVALFAGDHSECRSRAELAMEIGRELSDPEVEALGLLDSGHAGLCLEDVGSAVAQHEEAAALAMSGSLDPEVTGMVYCGVIAAAAGRGDWRRANEWTDSYARWCEQHPISFYPGLCRMHRAEIYFQKGDLDSARREIDDATELLERSAPWAAGEAHRVRGQVLLGAGDVDGATAAFRRSLEYGWEPQPGYAWLLFANGEPDRALRSLRRAIDSTSWGTAERRAFLRVEEVCLSLACGEPDGAGQALELVRGACSDSQSEGLCAEAARAEGEWALYEGRIDAAVESLRSARDGWLAVGSPPNAARARARLAEAYAQRGDEDLAAIELEAVQATFLPMGIDFRAA
jgi:DNA-binding winged helix-turn-helix (wHTH) protein/tetratricopeptide (TPR) repeat protein